MEICHEPFPYGTFVSFTSCHQIVIQIFHSPSFPFHYFILKDSQPLKIMNIVFSMNILPEWLRETYFVEAKQLKSKNKTYAQISHAATEFFKVFLNHKNRFELPYTKAEYRSNDVKSNSFNKWKAGAWASGTTMRLGWQL